jgi:hypothetical protein
MKIGRNDPCPCGSDQKYKKCCLAKDEANRVAKRPVPPVPSDAAEKSAIPRAPKPSHAVVPTSKPQMAPPPTPVRRRAV